MVSKTFTSMGFALCGLFFSILILMLYFSKRKKHIFTNKLFFILQISTIIFSLLEISYISSMAIYSFSSKLTEILCRTYLVWALGWLITLCYYVLFMGTRHIEPDVRRHKLRKNIIIVLISVMAITSLFSCMLPIVDSPYLNDLYSFGGPAAAIIFIIAFIIIIVILVVLLIRDIKFPREQKLPVYFAFIFVVLILTIQLLSGYDFNIVSFVASISVATLYFTVESQDNKLLAELEESNRQANISNRAKTEFLVNMSHEIRTPMNTILGFSDALLNEKDLTEEIVKRDSKNIYDASVSLLELINNILDISRIDSQKEKVVNKEYDLKTLVFEINSVISSKITNKEITFDIHVDENLPKKYYGDYGKMYKIIVNVLLNAISYTSYGNVTLDIHEKLPRGDNFIFEIVVSNTGHEMLERKFNIDFNDFVKVDNELGNKVDSVGLGLIVAKRLISMLNGEMIFKNETGKGTKYYIIVSQPIILEDKIGNIFEETDADIPQERALDLSGKRILIVDDNLINIKLARRLLEDYKATIDEASSGKECLDLINENKYDIVFLDHMMPDMDGIAVMKSIKNLLSEIPPIIALTANTYDGVKETYLDQGFTDYLAKPISYKHLNKIMHDVFDKDSGGMV